MISAQQLRTELGAAVSGAGTALAVADRLCQACVAFLDVDGASISLTLDGENRGTFGSSGDLIRRLDALQFTSGRAVPGRRPPRRGPVRVASQLASASNLRAGAMAGSNLDHAPVLRYVTRCHLVCTPRH